MVVKWGIIHLLLLYLVAPIRNEVLQEPALPTPVTPLDAMKYLEDSIARNGILPEPLNAAMGSLQQSFSTIALYHMELIRVIAEYGVVIAKTANEKAGELRLEGFTENKGKRVMSCVSKVAGNGVVDQIETQKGCLEIMQMFMHKYYEHAMDLMQCSSDVECHGRILSNTVTNENENEELVSQKLNHVMSAQKMLKKMMNNCLDSIEVRKKRQTSDSFESSTISPAHDTSTFISTQDYVTSASSPIWTSTTPENRPLPVTSTHGDVSPLPEHETTSARSFISTPLIEATTHLSSSWASASTRSYSSRPTPSWLSSSTPSFSSTPSSWASSSTPSFSSTPSSWASSSTPFYSSTPSSLPSSSVPSYSHTSSSWASTSTPSYSSATPSWETSPISTSQGYISPQQGTTLAYSPPMVNTTPSSLQYTTSSLEHYATPAYNSENGSNTSETTTEKPRGETFWVEWKWDGNMESPDKNISPPPPYPWGPPPTPGNGNSNWSFNRGRGRGPPPWAHRFSKNGANHQNPQEREFSSEEHSKDNSNGTMRSPETNAHPQTPMHPPEEQQSEYWHPHHGPRQSARFKNPMAASKGHPQRNGRGKANGHGNPTIETSPGISDNEYES